MSSLSRLCDRAPSSSVGASHSNAMNTLRDGGIEGLGHAQTQCHRREKIVTESEQCSDKSESLQSRIRRFFHFADRKTRLAICTATSHTIDQAKPEGSPDRNGRIHLQRRPRCANLRAASELHVTPKSIIHLHRKFKFRNLRAISAAHGPSITQQHPQTPVVETQTLDIMIQSLNSVKPEILTPKDHGQEKQNCCTCSYHATETFMAVCDVCNASFMPSGAKWTNWEAAGTFCPFCIRKAYEEISAEENEYEKEEFDSGRPSSEEEY